MGIQCFIQVPIDQAATFGQEIVTKGFYLWLMYQGWNVAFRKALVERSSKNSQDGTPSNGKNGTPQVRKTKDGEVPVLESEKDYTDWLLAEGTISARRLQRPRSEVAATIPVALPGSGESSRNLNKECYRTARAYLAQIKAGNMSADDRRQLQCEELSVLRRPWR